MNLKAASWTFLSNHSHVLICLNRNPRMRMREVADEVGITERAVQRIVHELIDAGILQVEKDGRRNRYHIRRDIPLRHPLESHRNVGNLLDVI